jgi:hypothetical protein
VVEHIVDLQPAFCKQGRKFRRSIQSACECCTHGLCVNQCTLTEAHSAL